MGSSISTVMLGAVLVVLAALAVAHPAMPLAAGQPLPPDIAPIVLVTGLMGLASRTRGPRI